MSPYRDGLRVALASLRSSASHRPGEDTLGTFITLVDAELSRDVRKAGTNEAEHWVSSSFAAEMLHIEEDSARARARRGGPKVARKAEGRDQWEFRASWVAEQAMRRLARLRLG